VSCIEIAGRRIGDGEPVYVIAEIGVNHDGSLERATALVEAAAAAGADAVKFQTFDPEALTTASAPLAAYQREGTDAASQRQMLERLQLADEDLRELAALCRRLGPHFLSTPFDEASAARLEALEVPAFKVGSGELTNLPFLGHLAARGLPLLVSTGMSDLDEVRAAVAAIDAAGAPPLALLHCVSSYPAAPEQANLRAMDALAAEFPAAVIGYSDHCLGLEVSIAAVARGAKVIERHITLDRTLPGPDHAISLEPEDLVRLVADIRTVESALGDGRKRPQEAEANTRAVARRSLVAARDLAQGRVLAAGDLAAKRPAGGLPPSALDAVLGRTLTRPLRCDEPLTEAHLSPR
jgi:N-acetylneuraminate synthase/N,N'-diacetyllegionaminate synthase